MDINIRLLAQELAEALHTRQPVEPLSERFPELTVDDAYAIQTEILRLRLEEGRRVIGRKIGLTSRAMQNMFNVHEPDFGFLLDDMVIINGEIFPAGQMLQPRCESEIAFLLKRDLTGPGITTEDVLMATEAVMPSLEIVDSRVKDWKIKLVDSISDNGSSAMLVLGDAVHKPESIDLRLVGMVFEKNGEILSTGAGAAVLGHPASAVAWLANKMAQFETKLNAGEVVLSGAITAASPIAPGDYFKASFDRLGCVSVKFS